MAFAEVFSDLRQKRRIPMREFAATAASINGIEKKGTLPTQERLESLISTFGEVAVNQGSEDGETEGRQLRSAWFEDHFVRLGIDPEVAPFLAQVATMDSEQQELAVQAVKSLDI